MKIALVAIAKDEDQYIDEWIAYHKMIGFTDIFIYMNNWNYKPKYNLDRVNFIPYNEDRPQVKCYNEFIEKYHEEFDFAAFFDIDEFLFIKSNLPLSEIMYARKQFPALFINWRYFGDSNLKYDKKNNSVINRFTNACKHLDELGKNIINFKISHTNVIFHDPHFLVTKEDRKLVKGVDPNAKKLIRAGEVNNEDEILQLFHFRNKTWDEYVNRKYQKPDAYHDFTKMKQNSNYDELKKDFTSKNFNEETNTSLKDMESDVKKFKSCLNYVSRCNEILPKSCTITDYVLFDYRYKNDASKMVKFLSRFHDVYDMTNTLFPTCYDKNNFHHWTPDYVWKNFIPTVLFKLGEEVNLNEFEEVENYYDGENYSYHELNKDQEFETYDFYTKVKLSGKDHRKIFRVSENENVRDKSAYHRLFRMSNDSCIIKNSNPLINKRVFINCDSMGIPVAPIMAYIFESVLVRDYRFGGNFENTIKDFKPDHYISLYLTNDYRDDLSIVKGLI